MKSKQIGDLSLRKALGWGGFRGLTEGQMLVARFCEAVGDGETPDKADLEAVAFALSVLMDGGDTAKNMAEVSRRLGVKTKQGKKVSQQRRDHFDEWEVAKYLQLISGGVAAGLTEKKAEMSARKTMMEQLGLSDRAMRDKVKKHLEGAKIQLALINEIRRQDSALREKLEAK